MTRPSKENPRTNIDAQRKGLLAKVHIAKKELGLDDPTYQSILFRGFGKISAARLANPELEHLVKHFESCGWVPRRRKGKEGYIAALRERVDRVAKEIPLADRRLRGLCRFICATDDPAWCRDTEKLRRLLAALGKIKREGWNEGKSTSE